MTFACIAKPHTLLLTVFLRISRLHAKAGPCRYSSHLVVMYPDITDTSVATMFPVTLAIHLSSCKTRQRNIGKKACMYSFIY